MSKSISRREVLEKIVRAGAGALLASGKTSAQKEAIRIADPPIEIALAHVGSHTLRLSFAPIENWKPTSIANDGSILPQAWVPPHAQLRTFAPFERISLGKLIITVAAEPLTITAHENGRLVQRLRVNKQTGAVLFDLGEGPVLGFGEGGPQFDRRGSKDEMRSGQGGYRLRTHGGRVPIPWLIGTGGCARVLPDGTANQARALAALSRRRGRHRAWR